MHFCPLFLCIFLSSFHTFWFQHVIFREIAKMAGALSYIHAIVPVNISSLVCTIAHFQCDVCRLKAGYDECKNQYQTSLNHEDWIFARINDLLDLALLDSDRILSTITSLKASLPRVDNTLAASYKISNQYRVKRGFPMMLINGIFGTLMGWFNQQQSNNLWDQLHEVQDHQNWLLQIQMVQPHSIEEIEAALWDILCTMELTKTAWPNNDALDNVWAQLCFNLQNLIWALHALHYRWPSIDLLPRSRLLDLFDATTLKAQAHRHQLMIQHPSDLLQLETSYLHDGQDVQLIVHILMAPNHSILLIPTS